MSRAVNVVRMRKNPSEEEGDMKDTKNEFFDSVRALLESMLYLLIDKHDEFFVEIRHGDKTTIFDVKCAHSDLGRILGRQGKMIASIRNVISGVTAKHGYRSVVELPYYPRAED